MNGNQSKREDKQNNLIQAEGTLLIGEALVAVGSIIVVIALIRAYKTLLQGASPDK